VDSRDSGSSGEWARAGKVRRKGRTASLVGLPSCQQTERRAPWPCTSGHRPALLVRIVLPESKGINIEEWAERDIIDDGPSLVWGGGGPDGPVPVPLRADRGGQAAEPAPDSPGSPLGESESLHGTRLRPSKVPDPGLEGQPALREVDSGEAEHQGGDEPRNLEWCAIVCKRSRGRIEFHVVVIEKGGAHRSVARSPALRAPSFGALRQRGAARVAHDDLVSRLAASGWRPVDSSGAWYEVGFVRERAVGVQMERSVVTAAREGGQAWFVVETLDTYGNGAQLEVSARFEVPRFRSTRPTEQAECAHEQLVSRMESEGWVVVGNACDEWYAASFERPA
jgi:hypothetical protein